MTRRTGLALLLGVIVAACGTATTPWADFQSRVLDVQERFGDSGSDITNATMLSYLNEQKVWAEAVKADACYDPALREYRSFLDDAVAAYAAINGRALSDVPIEDLQTAQGALTEAIEGDSRLTLAMTSARDICNR
jgi:hypothetical protein